MSMTKTEVQTIQNLITRLKLPNCGCSLDPWQHAAYLTQRGTEADVAIVTRLYLNTWVIPSLEMLLPGEGRNPQLAARLSGR